MARPETSWSAENSRSFADHDKTMRGHVRYEVVHHNLAQSLGEYLSEPKRIADIGGGTGIDAKWLADMPAGHDVYLVEPDRESRQQAVMGNNGVQIMDGTSQTALSYWGGESFDLVLSHGVLQYFHTPRQAQAELDNLTQLIKPGGYASILVPGMLGKLNRYQSRDEIAKLDQLRMSGKYINGQGIESLAWLPAEAQSMLSIAGLETVGWFGTRIFSDDDNRLVEEVSAFHRNRILDHELRASADATLRAGGQMLHCIARKKYNRVPWQTS